MEIKILNSILFSELMPWTFDTTNTKAISEKIKKAGDKSPGTNAGLLQQLQIILADYPQLSEWLREQDTKDISPLRNHSYTIDFPVYSDVASKFYNTIISLETLRFYNAFATKIQKYKKKIDIAYHTAVALRNIKSLAVNTVKELKQRGFEDEPTEQSTLSRFVLQLLRQHLTVLFFNIQELSKNSLENPTTIEDFYLLDLNLPTTAIAELQRVEITTDKIQKQTGQEILSFGFKGTEEKLKFVITQLNNQIHLLNEDSCTTDNLITILTSKALTNKMHKVYFGCETVQVRYIFDKLKMYFKNLNLASIEKSKLFYSKNNRLLNAQNLSASKIRNPKNDSDIDKIIKEMQ